MDRRGIGWMAGAVLQAGLALPAAEAANCNLRNPDRQIYEIFPEATNYRTIVANVDERAKPTVEEKLGSAVVFNDLGKHTIFVVLKGETPIGFIHPRSEIGKHGSVELVWALDLHVRDFRVQRSRETHTAAISGDGFRAGLLGKNYRSLKKYLRDGDTRVESGLLGTPSGAETIAHTAVLCGAKTLVITDVAFGEPLLVARLLGNAHRFFSGTAKVVRVAAPLNEEVLAKVRGLANDSADGAVPDPPILVRCQGAGGELLGIVVFSRWPTLPETPEL